MRPSSVEFLPEPDAPAARHSQRVLAHIVDRVVAQGGALSFSDYMHEVLYAPGLGYYSAGAAKFAETGDFTTAPELSPLFASVLAGHCAAVLSALGGGDIVEFGAGSGAMAAGILESLQQHDRLPQRYLIVEVSADLRARQQAAIAARVPALLSRVAWVDDPATLTLDGVVLANEVIDALPVERFRIGDDTAVSQQVVTQTDGELGLDWRAAPAPLAAGVRALEQRLGTPLPVGYQSELCMMLPAWLDTVAATLSRGVILMSDYGYGRRDYYAAERDRGTLTCHFRHYAHHDPLLWPGIQDITAWVDFSAVAEALRDAGAAYMGFTSQSQFLLNGGITDLLASAPPEQQAALARGVKTLALPGEMGERFRFIGFHRDCPLVLPGFSGRDYGAQL